MWESVVSLFSMLLAFLGLLANLFVALLPWLPGGLWCAWWLFCVNWKKAWPVLASGAWLGVVLLVLLVSLAWAAIFPAACDCLGLRLPNFWWQLGCASALTAIALFCGWLQDQLGWTPAEVSFDPPAAEHGHGHGGHH